MSATKVKPKKKVVKKATKKVDYNEVMALNNEKYAETIKNCNHVNATGRHSYQERKNGFLQCDCGRVVSIDEKVNKQFVKDAEKFEKEQKKKKKSKKEPEVEKTWIDSIDFRTIYSVRGQQCLFTSHGGANKQKRALMLEFMNTENRVMVSVSDLSNLNSFVFYTEKVKTLTLQEVFTNIDDNFDEIKHAIECGLLRESLRLFVPEYDKNQFKLHHAEKVWSWFNEIKTKVEHFVKEGEAEMEAEEKANE